MAGHYLHWTSINEILCNIINRSYFHHFSPNVPLIYNMILHLQLEASIRLVIQASPQLKHLSSGIVKDEVVQLNYVWRAIGGEFIIKTGNYELIQLRLNFVKISFYHMLFESNLLSVVKINLIQPFKLLFARKVQFLMHLFRFLLDIHDQLFVNEYAVLFHEVHAFLISWPYPFLIFQISQSEI